ncbi:MAG: isoprenylcysteine carboxylmethyltransferase family protein [Candidatus Rokubacteria bacterium]|nr:isoprenylcysteine carboxylmethyltransferase family protein [Candidatus Rokubacteria bacterium]
MWKEPPHQPLPQHGNGHGRRAAALGTIVLPFVVAFEIAIMISPFAVVFYAAFNPVLLALDRWSLTRWLTAFFLPHMIVPPDPLLVALRVLGSVLFVAGGVAFLACALQVYLGKWLTRGTAMRGLYVVIRHPQYLALAVAALGLVIMWPRFLTLALFAVMLFLYYLLARDEERRMAARHGEQYLEYMRTTGRFVPRRVEEWLGLASTAPSPPRVATSLGLLFGILVIVIGSGFVARAYTIRHLPLSPTGAVDVIGITADDVQAARSLLPDVLQDAEVRRALSAASQPGHRILAYVVPIDYTMQGMIADTGEEWKLFGQHKTIAMITEYVLHPFAHLTEGHAHGGGLAPAPSLHDSPAMKRRIIFIDVWAEGRALEGPRDDFAIDVRRRPLLFADVHLHTGEVLQVRPTPPGTGWGRVPTPMF